MFVVALAVCFPWPNLEERQITSYPKRNKMTLVVPLPWQLFWVQSVSVKNLISSFATLLSSKTSSKDRGY